MPDWISRRVKVARTRARHRWKAVPPFGGVRLPPVSLAPCCQKISTKNGLTITITLTLTITRTLTLPNHNPDPNPKLTLHIYRPTHPNRL